MTMHEKTMKSDPRLTALANSISDAIAAALTRGLDVDEATCVTVAVAADYGRAAYGDTYCQALAGVAVAQAGRPLPKSK